MHCTNLHVQISFPANKQRGFRSAGGNRRRCSPSLRAEAAACRRVPSAVWRAVRVRAVHRLAGQVRGSRRRPLGQVRSQVS